MKKKPEKKPVRMVVVTIKVPPSVRAALVKAAKKDKMVLSQFVRALLERVK